MGAVASTLAAGPAAAAGPADHRRDWVALLLVVLPACLIVTLRGDTRDTVHYIDAFQATDRFPTHPVLYYAEQGVEWGFGVLSWAVQLLGLGWRALFLAISLGTFAFLGLGARAAGLRLRQVAPFYLPTFFVTQQLMQIRQGLGMAMAFYVVIELQAQGPRWRHALVSLAAVSIHTVSIVPVLVALAWRFTIGRGEARFRWWHALLLVGGAVAAARVATHIDVFSAMDRLSSYAEDENYHGERGILQAANVRAVLMLALLMWFRPPERHRRVYAMLLALYATSVGVRLGFYDFEILSGRIGSAVAFGEVYGLALVAWTCLRSRFMGRAFAAGYFLAQGAVTLGLQVPFMWGDYFQPIPRSGPF